MKKNNIFLLFGVCVVMIAACGNKNNSEVNNVSESSTDVTVQEEQQEVEVEQSSDEESNIEDFEYVVLEDGTAGIQSYKGDANTVIIPEDIDGLKVTSVSGVAYNDAVEKIVIPDSVTVIDTNAFTDDRNLSEVVMGQNIQTIGDRAFSGDYALVDISIPTTVTEIGEQAFMLAGIKEVSIPAGVSVLEDGVFCLTALQSVTIPGNVKTIGVSAFEGCEDLQIVTIEEGVESIESRAFKDTESVTRLEIPASVTTIDTIFGDDCTIVAPAGSYAESFCNEKGYNFEAK